MIPFKILNKKYNTTYSSGFKSQDFKFKLYINSNS